MALISETVEKKYRYIVTKDDGSRVDWPDVISDFEYDDEINTGGSELRVLLGRNPYNTSQDLEILITESGENLQSEDGQDLEAPFSLINVVGEGTDVDTDLKLEVYEFYGAVENLLTESDEDLLMENNENLLYQYGATGGRCMFSGYIESYDLAYVPGQNGLGVVAMPGSADMNEYLAADSDVAWEYQVEFDSEIGLGSTDGNDFNKLAQTFTYSRTGDYLTRLIIAGRAGDAVLWPQLHLHAKIYQGAFGSLDPVVISEADFTLESSQASAVVTLAFVFAGGVELVNGEDYYFEISIDEQRTSTSDPFPFYLATNANPLSYPPGILLGEEAMGYVSTLEDAYFLVMTDLGNVTAEFVDKDLRTILINSMAPAVERGARFSYDLNTVMTTGRNATVTFKLDTVRQVFDYVMKNAPLGWFWRWDNETQTVIFRNTSPTPDHEFRMGVHLQSMNLIESIEDIKNIVYVIGGGDPALLKRYANQPSIDLYGQKMIKIYDARIIDEDQASIVGLSELVARAQPTQKTTITVLDKVYDTSTIRIGDLISFTGGGDLIDSLQLRVVWLRRMKGKVTLRLGSTYSSERKRVDQIRKDLDQYLAENTPDIAS